MREMKIIKSGASRALWGPQLQMVLEKPRDVKEKLLTLAGVCQFHWVDVSSREDVCFFLSLSIAHFSHCAFAFRLVSATVHTKQVEPRLKYCQPCRRERPLSDTSSSIPARTLKWHYSLAPSFSLSPSLFLFHQSGIRVPWQQNWAPVGGWLRFILIMTPHSRGSVEDFAEVTCNAIPPA